MDMAAELRGRSTGVLIRPPAATAWRAGGESGAVRAVLEPGRDYGAYLPDEEAQARFAANGMLLVDTSACVTFSGSNALETLLNRMLALGLLPASHVAFLKQGGYINAATGKVNFSDRFSAKINGTTANGNYLEAVADSFRNAGLVAESDWPWPFYDEAATAALSAQERLALYYSPVPQALIEKALTFRSYFDITYEYVLTGTSHAAALHAALQYGPVQVAAAVCSPWSSTDGMPPIPACGCSTQHATLVYGRDASGAWRDFDHYKSFRKLLASDYCIPWGMQYFVTVKAGAAAPTAPTAVLYRGAPASTAVRALQQCLQYVHDPATGKPYMAPGVFGSYGPATQGAVARFQVVSGIPDAPQGFHYGPKTRTALQAAINAQV